MNCKPGELAVVVYSEAGNEGKFVTCIRVMDGIELDFFNYRKDTPVWLIDRLVNTTGEFLAPLMPDIYLRPIRDPGEDAQDESRAWLPPVPTQHKETA